MAAVSTSTNLTYLEHQPCVRQRAAALHQHISDAVRSLHQNDGSFDEVFSLFYAKLQEDRTIRAPWFAAILTTIEEQYTARHGRGGEVIIILDYLRPKVVNVKLPWSPLPGGESVEDYDALERLQGELFLHRESPLNFTHIETLASRLLEQNFYQVTGKILHLVQTRGHLLTEREKRMWEKPSPYLNRRLIREVIFPLMARSGGNLTREQVALLDRRYPNRRLTRECICLLPFKG